jgi:hypothetical protein
VVGREKIKPRHAASKGEVTGEKLNPLMGSTLRPTSYPVDL